MQKRVFLLLLFFGIFGLILCSNVSAQGSSSSLCDAIEEGLVTATINSTGSASGYIANLTITSNLYDPLTVDIENSSLEGMVLVNPNVDEQDLVITDVPGVSTGATTYEPADNVTFNPGESVTLLVEGYCINFDKDDPTEGTKFSLNETSEKANVTQLAGILQTLENTTFPDNFTEEHIFTVKQIAVWMAQTENKDKTAEEYAERGYPIEEEDIPIISEILEETGIDPEEITALPDEPYEPEEPAEGFPWGIVLIPAIIAIIGVITYLGLKPKKPKPKIAKPPSERADIELMPHPSEEEEAAKKDPCDEIRKQLEEKKKELEWKRKHLTASIGEGDKLIDKAEQDVANLEKKYAKCLGDNCRFEKLEEIAREKMRELGQNKPPSEADLKKAQKELQIAYDMVHNYEINIKSGGMSPNHPGFKKAKERLKRAQKRRNLIAQILDLEKKIAVCKEKRAEQKRIAQLEREKQERARRECERKKQECLKDVERLKQQIRQLRKDADNELYNSKVKARGIDGREVWNAWRNTFRRFRRVVRGTKFQRALHRSRARDKLKDYEIKGLWDWGGALGTAVGYGAEDLANAPVPTDLIKVAGEAGKTLSSFFAWTKKTLGSYRIEWKWTGKLASAKYKSHIDAAKEFAAVHGIALQTFRDCFGKGKFKKLEDKIKDLIKQAGDFLKKLPSYPSDVDLGECIKGCEKAKAQLQKEKEEMEKKIEQFRDKINELDKSIKQAEDYKKQIEDSVESMKNIIPHLRWVGDTFGEK